MKRLLDGLAWFIIGTVALAFVVGIVCVIVRDPWTLLALVAAALVVWAGLRLLEKL